MKFEIDFLTTPDRKKIGYRKIGSGPNLILVHGGLQSSANFIDLAAALAPDFTVYIPDRRGRGLSDPYQENDSLTAETNDLLALINHSKSQNIFALSSGAVITLQAALNGSPLKKIALYEPPLPPNENVFYKLDRMYGKAMRENNAGAGLIAILKTIDDTSFSLLRALPGLISVPLINLMMRLQSGSKDKNEPALKELVPTFAHDRMIVRDAIAEDLVKQSGKINADVLLLQGGGSQPFLGQAIERLMAAMPLAKRVKFSKYGHMAADNTGAPKEVAAELLNFFKEI